MTEMLSDSEKFVKTGKQEIDWEEGLLVLKRRKVVQHSKLG